MIDYPPAYVLSIEPNPSYPEPAALVTVRCPYCDRGHVHGLPEGGVGPDEHRASHCGQGDGYIITMPEAEVTAR